MIQSPERRIEAARMTLLQARLAIGKVAEAGAKKYQGKTSRPSIRHGYFQPDSRRDRYKVAFTTDYEIPAAGEFIEGYRGVRVMNTSSRTVDHPWTDPHETQEIGLVFIVEPRTGEFDSQVSITSTGDARFSPLVVNSLPEESIGGTPDEEMRALQKRTQEGLLIAQFVAATLDQVHAIQGLPKDGLEEAQDRLQEESGTLGIPLEPGIAVLLPRAK